MTVVTDSSNVLLIDTTGKIIRLSPTEIRTMGRQAQGVRLIRLNEDQRLSAVVSLKNQQLIMKKMQTHQKRLRIRRSKLLGLKIRILFSLGKRNRMMYHLRILAKRMIA